MSWNTRRDFRKLHRWGAIWVALPFLIVLVTGLILQVKKEFEWIQPEGQVGSISNVTPDIGFEQILAAAMSDPQAEISGWEDIDRLDIRIDDGIAKVRSVTNWEQQVDLGTGELIYSMKRRSDIIESIHDGSWFHDSAKLWIFLPSALIVTGLWVTGIYLFFVPVFSKRTNRQKLARRKKRRRHRRKALQQQE